jgi:hypothetical protein
VKSAHGTPTALQLSACALVCASSVVSSLWLSQSSNPPLCIGFDISISTGAPSGSTLFYVGNTDNSI